MDEYYIETTLVFRAEFKVITPVEEYHKFNEITGSWNFENILLEYKHHLANEIRDMCFKSQIVPNIYMNQRWISDEGKAKIMKMEKFPSELYPIRNKPKITPLEAETIINRIIMDIETWQKLGEVDDIIYWQLVLEKWRRAKTEVKNKS